MSLPDKSSKSQLRFDPNVYTTNGNSGVRVITQERRRKNAFFKSYHLHEKLLWKKKRNKQLIAFSINCIPKSCWPTGGKGLHRVINNEPPGLLMMTHYFVTEGTLGS